MWKEFRKGKNNMSHCTKDFINRTRFQLPRSNNLSQLKRMIKEYIFDSIQFQRIRINLLQIEIFATLQLIHKQMKLDLAKSEYFSFPPNEFKDEQFSSLQQLKESLKNSENIKFKFTSHLYPKQEIHIECENCRAKLIYKTSSKVYNLIVFKNEHHHPKPKSTSDSNQKQPLTENSTKEGSTESENPSKAFQKVRAKDPNHIKNILKQLETQNNTVTALYSADNTFEPYLALIISNQMKENYQRFGDVVCFSIVNHLLKDKTYNSIGLFTGVDTGQRVVIFGYCIIMSKQNNTLYEQLFRAFFQKMEKPPESFFTDQRTLIRVGLEKIQEEGLYPGMHLYDTFQIVNRIKKKLNDKDKLTLYTEAIGSTTEKEYEDCIEKIRNVSKNEQIEVLTSFTQKAKQFCFSKIPEVFVGMSVTESITEKVSQLVRANIPQGTIREVIKSIEQKEKPEKPIMYTKNIEDYFNCATLKFYRECLEEKIFKIAAYLYFQKGSLQIVSENLDDNEIVVGYSKCSDLYRNDEQARKFIIREEVDKFFCSCGVTTKIGIPCAHLIKVLEYKRISVATYINPRWVVNAQDEEKIKEGMEARKNNQLISLGDSDDELNKNRMMEIQEDEKQQKIRGYHHKKAQQNVVSVLSNLTMNHHIENIPRSEVKDFHEPEKVLINGYSNTGVHEKSQIQRVRNTTEKKESDIVILEEQPKINESVPIHNETEKNKELIVNLHQQHIRYTNQDKGIELNLQDLNQPTNPKLKLDDGEPGSVKPKQDMDQEQIQQVCQKESTSNQEIQDQDNKRSAEQAGIIEEYIEEHEKSKICLEKSSNQKQE